MANSYCSFRFHNFVLLFFSLFYFKYESLGQLEQPSKKANAIWLSSLLNATLHKEWSYHIERSHWTESKNLAHRSVGRRLSRYRDCSRSILYILNAVRERGSENSKFSSNNSQNSFNTYTSEKCIFIICFIPNERFEQTNALFLIFMLIPYDWVLATLYKISPFFHSKITEAI